MKLPLQLEEGHLIVPRPDSQANESSTWCQRSRWPGLPLPLELEERHSNMLPPESSALVSSPLFQRGWRPAHLPPLDFVELPLMLKEQHLILSRLDSLTVVSFLRFQRGRWTIISPPLDLIELTLALEERHMILPRLESPVVVSYLRLQAGTAVGAPAAAAVGGTAAECGRAAPDFAVAGLPARVSFPRFESGWRPVLSPPVWLVELPLVLNEGHLIHSRPEISAVVSFLRF